MGITVERKGRVIKEPGERTHGQGQWREVQLSVGGGVVGVGKSCGGEMGTTVVEQ